MIQKNIFSRTLLYIILNMTLWLPDIAFAFSIKQFLGIPESEEVTVNNLALQSNSEINHVNDMADNELLPVATAGSSYDEKLTFLDLKNILSILSVDQRKKILSDVALFKNFVLEELANISLLKAAKDNKVDQTERLLLITQRLKNNMIREFYLNQLLKEKIPSEFPSDEQIDAFYLQNKDKFIVEEQIHIWQIFLPITKQMNKEQLQTLEKKALSISHALKNDELNFATAANQYSKHEASRLNGGYMGLIKIDHLKPEFIASIEQLGEGSISSVIHTDEGRHILKKGATVPKQAMTLEQAKPQIAKLMLEQLKVRTLKSILQQTQASYPVSVDDSKIAEWYLKLRVN